MAGDQLTLLVSTPVLETTFIVGDRVVSNEKFFERKYILILAHKDRQTFILLITRHIK